MLKHPLSRIAFTLTVGAYLPSSFALDYTVDLLLQGEYQDNAELTSNGRSDTRTSAGVELGASHNTQRLQLIGDYALLYSEYDNNTNDDRSELSGDSAIRAQLLPQRLYWSLSHSLSEETSRRSDTDRADNRERRQEITTGPELQLSLTDVDTLALSAEYREVMFSTPSDNTSIASADSTSQSAAINWLHAFSTITEFTSGYRYRETERDSTATLPERTTEFQIAYVGFNRNLREMQYGLQVGGTRAKPDGGSSTSGLYFQGDLVFTSADSSLALSASRQQTESSTGLDSTSQVYSAFDSSAALFSAGIDQGNYDAEGVVEVSSYQVNYQSERYCSRCSYGLGYSYVESDYEELSETDDKEHSINAEYNWRLNSRLTASVFGRWESTEFDDQSEDQDEAEGVLELRWRASSVLDIALFGGYEDRSGGTTNDYHNSFGGIELRYTALSSRE